MSRSRQRKPSLEERARRLARKARQQRRAAGWALDRDLEDALNFINAGPPPARR